MFLLKNLSRVFLSLTAAAFFLSGSALAAENNSTALDQLLQINSSLPQTKTIPRISELTGVSGLDELAGISADDPNAYVIFVSSIPGLTTEVTPLTEGSEYKIVKYPADTEDFSSFDAEEAWTNETPIADGDILVIGVTGPDGEQAYYKIFAETVDYEEKVFEGTSFYPSLPYREAAVNASQEGKASLVVVLHGGSGRGTDNLAQLGNIGTNMSAIIGYFSSIGKKAIVVAPQSPREVEGSEGPAGLWQKPEEVVDLKALVDDILAHNPEIDVNRIYFMGVGTGSNACLQIAANYPELPAAIMPAEYQSRKEVSGKEENIAKVPMYLVVANPGGGAFDPNNGNSDAFVEQLNAQGAQIEYEVLDNNCDLNNPEDPYNSRAGHVRFCLLSYFDDARLSWVFSQSR